MNSDNSNVLELTSHDKKWACIAYLVPFLGAGDMWGVCIVAPLIVWILKKDESPFVDFHGRQIVNLEINLALIGLVAYGAFSLFKIAGVPVTDSGPSILFCLVIAVVLMAWFVLVGLYYTIKGARSAYRGEWYKIQGIFGKKWF